MTVTQWNPRGSSELLDKAFLQRMVSTDLDENSLGLDAGEVKSFAPIMHIKADVWLEVCSDLEAQDLVAICKWLTLAEVRLDGWLAGDQSPVIIIARLLRQKDEYPKALTAWIREHSSNRFLPYGSLMDRL